MDAHEPHHEPQLERGLEQVLRGFDQETLGRIGWGFGGGGRPAFDWPATAPPILAGVEFAVRRLDPERTRALRAWGRSRGATLNDVLLAAFYRSLISLCEPPTDELLPVQVPVDLRRYLPGKVARAVCNLSSAVWPAITRRSAASFGGALTAVTQAMASSKADYPGIGAALFVDRAFSQPFSQAVELATRSMQYGDGRSHPYLSNLGALTTGETHATGTQSFGDLAIADAFLVSPALYPPGLMVGVSTFAEMLTLTVGYPANLSAASLVERLLDSMHDELATYSRDGQRSL